ncbi:MAG: 2-phosphosulfolactate phosphatase [Gemmataceae bacterium]
MAGRTLHVHLSPALVSPEVLAGGVVVVVDVLRATTTMVHALAAGCDAIRPCATVDEARHLCDHLPAGKSLLCGEREGMPLPGFDLGNSPREYTSARCKGMTLVLTTSNGTRALLHAEKADRVLIAAFANYSAVCEQLRTEQRPIHILCAGESQGVALEDTLLAGALVDFLVRSPNMTVDDGARIAWDCFEHHGLHLEEAMRLGSGGARLQLLGYDEDIPVCARVDGFHLVLELRRTPWRVEIASVGITGSHWRFRS